MLTTNKGSPSSSSGIVEPALGVPHGRGSRQFVSHADHHFARVFFDEFDFGRQQILPPAAHHSAADIVVALTSDQIGGLQFFLPHTSDRVFRKRRAYHAGFGLDAKEFENSPQA